ncbi:MAG: PaaI family thioesterase [Terriglobales bacterium]
MAERTPVHVSLPLAFNNCFGCGKDNRGGMHLKFRLGDDGKSFVANIRLSRRYEGPPGHAHGGVIATVLDEAMGKVTRLRAVLALTKDMQIDYLKPVPLGEPLIAEGRSVRVRGRVHFYKGEIRNRSGEVLARSRGTYIAIDPKKSEVFAKHMRNNPGLA